jgi:hypothetical protein
MPGFFEHWAHANIQFLERALAAAKRLFPGSPEYGVIFFHENKEHTMGEFTGDASGGQLQATVTFMDKEGNQTTPDDVPQWASSDESVATVTASEDGTGATVDRGGPGATQITVTTTDDDGDEHVFAGTVTLNPGDVEVGEITFTESGGGVAEPPAETPPPEEPVS